MKRRDPIKFVTCPGSRIHLHYEAKHDGQRVILVESGSSDIQDQIESYGKYTDLHYMLHRLAVGDRSVMSSRPPIYGDFSGLPDNPVDAINLVHSAEARFGELSAAERANYNNDYRSWLASILFGDSSGTNPVPDRVEPDVVKEDTKVVKEETKE